MAATTKAAAQDRPSLFAPLHASKAEKLTWLVPGRFLAAALNLLEGRKGLGKSHILAAVSAQVTGGPPLPGGRRQKAARVIWLAAEEDSKTDVLPRLQAAGASVKLVQFPVRDPETGRVPRLHFPTDIEILEHEIIRLGVRAVVLDPWESYVDMGLDINQAQHVRSMLEPLADMASRTRCAIIMTRHIRKSSYGPAIDQGMGSVAIGNVCRVVTRVFPHPQDKTTFCWAVVACNLAARAETLTYQIAEGSGGGTKIVWTGKTTLSAEALAEGSSDEASRDALGDARKLLRSIIRSRY